MVLATQLQRILKFEWLKLENYRNKEYRLKHIETSYKRKKKVTLASLQTCFFVSVPKTKNEICCTFLMRKNIQCKPFSRWKQWSSLDLQDLNTRFNCLDYNFFLEYFECQEDKFPSKLPEKGHSHKTPCTLKIQFKLVQFFPTGPS